SPNWLSAIHALPMYLGLDLRGGVHFLLQVDTAAAITKRVENLAADLRTQLRDKNIRHGGIAREGQTVRIRFREAATRDQGRAYILNNIPDLNVAERDDGQNLLLVCTVKPEFQKQVYVTGDQFIGASATFDQDQRPAVAVELDDAGGRTMRQVTRENVKHLMAIILFEKGKGEAISVATIQSEFGSRFQITGAFTPNETRDLSLLIRAGSLAAPMEIIEERTVGPSLGRDNISKGFHATLWGFTAIVVFMSIYYVVFGLISSLALAVNLLLLIALLSLLQATLTLPGIAAIALTLGMAIDANVLINERIREELRGGATPQAAIAAGYERAWGTILDSNVTTLIAGLALLIFGQGPVRGFAVVHCLGILTSMFSAVT